jgi:hypothetical protein
LSIIFFVGSLVESQEEKIQLSSEIVRLSFTKPAKQFLEKLGEQCIKAINKPPQVSGEMEDVEMT